MIVILYYMIAYLISFITLSVLILLHPRQRNIYYTLLFVVMCISCGGHLSVALSLSLPQAVLGSKIARLGSCFVTPMVYFSVCDLLRRKSSVLHNLMLMVLAFLQYILVLSDGHLNLIYRVSSLVRLDGYSYIVHQLGPLYFLFPLILVAYTIMVIALLLIDIFKVHDLPIRISTPLVTLMFIGCLTSCIGNSSNTRINWTPGLYSIAGWIFLTILMRVDMYDLPEAVALSAAQQNIMGHVSFDSNGKFLSCDDTAVRFFPELGKLHRESFIPTILRNRELFQTFSELLINNGETDTSKDIHVGDHYYRCRMYPIHWARILRRNRKGYLIEISDVTKEQEYMQLLQDYNTTLQKMANVAQSANNAKSMFLSNMSHEIRTPINAILGMDEMILRECTDSNIITYAEDIQSAGNTLLALINDILDFSKIEAGKLELIPSSFDMSSLLNDLIIMMRQRAESKGLSLILKIDPLLPTVLRGDDVRLKQIISNILTNAVKYTVEGSVTFSVGFRKVDSYHIELLVSVKDTGRGIKPEDKEKLFRQFERIDEEGIRNVEGAGLGLNITQRLLEMMGSHVEVESVYGEGSDFHFAVNLEVLKWEPLGNFQQALVKLHENDAAYHETFTAPDAVILAVDDTPANLAVIKGLLKNTQIRIDTASSGLECIDKADRTAYDLILLDHRMPGMDGMETLKHLQYMAATKNHEIPIICLTANAISGAREQYLAAGFTDYLTKPIKSAYLEKMLIEYLPREKVHLTTLIDDGATDESVSKEQTILLQELAPITSLDPELGITQSGGPEVYRKVLGIFASSAKDSADRLQRSYDLEDFDDYGIAVHALKSTARTIGDLDLSNIAATLEHAANARDLDVIHEHHQHLLSMYRSLGEEISKALHLESDLRNKDDSNLPMISVEDLNDALDSLRILVENIDVPNINSILSTLAEYRIPEAYQEQVKHLVKAAEEFRWDDFQNLLQGD